MFKPTTSDDSSDISHSGHRERLRNVFINTGTDGLAPHNVLELLLFFSIPRCDTNEIAHRLINEFGTLHDVFTASFDDLCRVKGIGRRTATLITLVAAISRDLASEACKQNINFIESAEDAAIYLKPKFIGAVTEMFTVLCLDNRGAVRKCSVFKDGGVDSIRADIRSIVAEILNCKATSVFLAHNHPHGFSIPSENDIAVTKELSSILSAFDIRIIDHIIFSTDDYLFMSANRNAAPYLNIRPLRTVGRQKIFSDKKNRRT